MSKKSITVASSLLLASVFVFGLLVLFTQDASAFPGSAPNFTCPGSNCFCNDDLESASDVRTAPYTTYWQNVSGSIYTNVTKAYNLKRSTYGDNELTFNIDNVSNGQSIKIWVEAKGSGTLTVWPRAGTSCNISFTASESGNFKWKSCTALVGTYYRYVTLELNSTENVNFYVDGIVVTDASSSWAPAPDPTRTPTNTPTRTPTLTSNMTPQPSCIMPPGTGQFPDICLTATPVGQQQ